MKSQNRITILMTVFWLIACAACFGALTWYKQKPGPVGKLNTLWPQNISYQINSSNYNLVLFAHPKCGCTYASIVELEKLIYETKNKLSVKIFFYRPKGSEKNWSDGESKNFAAKLTHTEIIDDVGGETARRFGAMTSGQVMVYSPEAKLSYAGGITESRGHVGDNAGVRSIASLVETGKVTSNFQHTFGCMLFSEKELKEYRN